MYKAKPNLFKEEKHPKTGESSLSTHTPKVIFECKGHYWVVTGNRELTCKHCKCMSLWNVGLYDLKDGKLIPRS